MNEPTGASMLQSEVQESSMSTTTSSSSDGALTQAHSGRDATVRTALSTEHEASSSMNSQVVARSNIGTAFYLFNHQAGGHNPFLRSALGEVCKPAIPLELQFYQSLDARYPQLKAFVPPFVGVITVDLHPMTPAEVVANAASSVAEDELASYSDNSDGDASSLSEDDNREVSPSPSAALVDGQMNALQLHSPTNAATAVPPGTSGHGKKRRLGEDSAAVRPFSSSVPSQPLAHDSSASYSAKLWKKERSKSLIARKAASSAAQQRGGGALGVGSLSREYLVLADLTLQYSRPCVLDIKMGTRQHGEDAPPAKAKSHSAKCAATTSLALGLRVCGMQIYDQVEQRYILWDKHWGRQLQEADIEPALTTYLSNGAGLHWDSLHSLRTKLQELEGVITHTTRVRFWGSSLLLIYEGDLRNARRREDVHLIDFAHCQMTGAPDSPDDGLLLGLANIIKYLTNILETRPPKADDTVENETNE